MSTQPIPIYQGQDFYVPYFEVRLSGRPLTEQVVHDIMQVTYKDNIEEIDNFEIAINNWDAEKRAFKYSDQELFNPGKKLELWMGYYGKDRLRLMIRGGITSLRPNFPAEGPSTQTRARSAPSSHSSVSSQASPSNHRGLWNSTATR